ncbi:MAG: ThuA domain-containing protein [Actinomycetota bacterium]|nr:ThuA domain-containing protein [Actinomycetota bacterium]
MGRVGPPRFLVAGAATHSPMRFFAAAGPIALAAILLACLGGGQAGSAQGAEWTSCHPPAPARQSILVFSRTAGYRHGSIPEGVEAIRRMGSQLNFAVEHTEDPGAFTDAGLDRHAAVVFLNTTGDVLDLAQQLALERFIRAGGGFAGVHSAADTEYDWPWYGELVGAWFERHPAIQEARLAVVDSGHPATRCLPATWTRRDEWYDFRSTPPAGATILLTLDESSYRGGRMGTSHPVSWFREFDGGRAWYTALGHTGESYTEPAFLDHLAGGILWVMGVGQLGSGAAGP